MEWRLSPCWNQCFKVRSASRIKMSLGKLFIHWTVNDFCLTNQNNPINCRIISRCLMIRNLSVWSQRICFLQQFQLTFRIHIPPHWFAWKTKLAHTCRNSRNETRGRVIRTVMNKNNRHILFHSNIFQTSRRLDTPVPR
jgi:hypothetical protein